MFGQIRAGQITIADYYQGKLSLFLFRGDDGLSALPVSDSHPQVAEQPLSAVRLLGLSGALVSPELLQLTQTIRLQQVGKLLFYLRRL